MSMDKAIEDFMSRDEKITMITLDKIFPTLDMVLELEARKILNYKKIKLGLYETVIYKKKEFPLQSLDKPTLKSYFFVWKKLYKDVYGVEPKWLIYGEAENIQVWKAQMRIRWKKYNGVDQ